MQLTSREVSVTSALAGTMLGMTMGMTIGFASAEIPQISPAEAVVVETMISKAVDQQVESLFSNEETFRSFWEWSYTLPSHKEQVVDCEQVKSNELLTLACNIYWEARGEPLEGQIAVATVTRNRVNSQEFPDTYSQVVWQRRGRIPQFEWTLDGRSDIVRDPVSWARALAVAALVMYDVAPDVTNGAQFYHAVGLDNSATRWFRTKLVQDSEIGNHVFYLSAI